MSEICAKLLSNRIILPATICNSNILSTYLIRSRLLADKRHGSLENKCPPKTILTFQPSELLRNQPAEFNLVIVAIPDLGIIMSHRMLGIYPIILNHRVGQNKCHSLYFLNIFIFSD